MDWEGSWAAESTSDLKAPPKTHIFGKLLASHSLMIVSYGWITLARVCTTMKTVSCCILLSRVYHPKPSRRALFKFVYFVEPILSIYLFSAVGNSPLLALWTHLASKFNSCGM